MMKELGDLTSALKLEKKRIQTEIRNTELTEKKLIERLEGVSRHSRTNVDEGSNVGDQVFQRRQKINQEWTKKSLIEINSELSIWRSKKLMLMENLFNLERRLIGIGEVNREAATCARRSRKELAINEFQYQTLMSKICERSKY